jgi:hypothetical protein
VKDLDNTNLITAPTTYLIKSNLGKVRRRKNQRLKEKKW